MDDLTKAKALIALGIPLDYGSTRTATWISHSARPRTNAELRESVLRDLPWARDAGEAGYLAHRCVEELGRLRAGVSPRAASPVELLQVPPFSEHLDDMALGNGANFASTLLNGAVRTRTSMFAHAAAAYAVVIQSAYGRWPLRAAELRGKILRNTLKNLEAGSQQLGIPCQGALVLSCFLDPHAPGADHELEVTIVVSCIPAELRGLIAIHPAFLDREEYEQLNALNSGNP